MHCLNCGGVLIGISKKFCCVECKTEHNSKNKKEARHSLREFASDKNCLWCGNCFEVTLKTANKRYCCAGCKKKDKYARKKAGVASDYVPPTATYKRLCERCGDWFDGTELQVYCSKECQNQRKCTCCGVYHSNGGYFCSDVCKHDWDSIHIGTVAVCNQCGHEFDWFGNSNICYCSDECRKELGRMRSNEYLTKKHVEAIGVHECKQCGDKFVPVYGEKRRKFCSGACADKFNKFIRSSSNVDRAIQYGVAYEYFDEFKVLEDCGWVCSLCGERTPKELRGTYEDNAPELEHVVPLSRGGTHTLNNVTCACRRCNGEKSSTSLLLHLAYANGCV